MNKCAWCGKEHRVRGTKVLGRHFCDEECIASFFIELGSEQSGTVAIPTLSREEISELVEVSTFEPSDKIYFSRSLKI